MVRKMAMTVISIAVKIMLIVAVICLLVWGGKKGFEFGVSIFTPSSVEEAPGKDVTVTIKSGTGKMDVGKLLEEKGLIEDYKVFWLQAILYECDIKSGEYTLNTSMTSEDILEVIKAKKTED